MHLFFRLFNQWLWCCNILLLKSSDRFKAKSSLKYLGFCFSNKVFGRLQNPVAFFHLLMLLVLLKHTVNLTFFRKAESFHGDQQ